MLTFTNKRFKNLTGKKGRTFDFGFSVSKLYNDKGIAHKQELRLTCCATNPDGSKTRVSIYSNGWIATYELLQTNEENFHLAIEIANENIVKIEEMVEYVLNKNF